MSIADVLLFVVVVMQLASFLFISFIYYMCRSAMKNARIPDGFKSDEDDFRERVMVTQGKICEMLNLVSGNLVQISGLISEMENRIGDRIIKSIPPGSFLPRIDEDEKG